MERARHIKEQEARIRDAKLSETEALIYRKERRLFAFEEARQSAVKAEKESKMQEIKSKVEVEMRAIVRWLSAPKMVSLLLKSKNTKIKSVMLAMMRVSSTGKLLPARSLDDALVLRWTDSSQKELGRMAVAEMCPGTCDEVESVISLFRHGDVEGVRFEFSDRGEALWYLKGLEKIRTYENTF